MAIQIQTQISFVVVVVGIDGGSCYAKLIWDDKGTSVWVMQRTVAGSARELASE